MYASRRRKSLTDAFIKNLQFTELGQRYFPRKEYYEKIKEASENTFKQEVFGTSISDSPHPNKFFDPTQHASKDKGPDPDALINSRTKWLEQERDKWVEYTEWNQRGFVKPDISRALFINAFGNVRDIYGDAANDDKFRHLEYGLIPGDRYLYGIGKNMDQYRRRLDHTGRDANKAVVDVKAASLNVIDFWISQGVGAEYILNRGDWMRWMLRVIVNPMKFMPSYEQRTADQQVKDLVAPTLRREYRRSWHGQRTDIDYKGIYPFPMILGRDFCGTLKDLGGAIGHAAFDDRVWGVRAPWQAGTIIDCLDLTAGQFAKAPERLTDIEAAAVPYCGVTLVNGLLHVLDESNAKGKRVLVIGCAGGMGHLAVQVLNAWGAKVWGMCNSNAKEFMSENNLETEKLYFYDEHPERPLELVESEVDVIINCCGDENKTYKYSDIITALAPNGWYVTFNTTLFQHLQKSSPVVGFFSAEKDHRHLRKYFKSKNRNARWGIFNDRWASFDLDRLKTLADNGCLKPVITSQVDVKDSVNLFINYAEKSARGKQVIDLSNK